VPTIVTALPTIASRSPAWFPLAKEKKNTKTPGTMTNKGQANTNVGTDYPPDEEQHAQHYQQEAD